MICHFNMKAEENFKTLCKLTTRLLDLPEGALASRNRKQKYQVPRAVVSMIARIEDGTHRDIIGKIINRNRTSINHYERTHSSNYSSFPYYRDTFNKIYNAYVDIKESKKNFIDMYHLKDHLRREGVKNSSNHQTTIRITSGKFGTDIKVSYRDFYNQLEICKLALQNYKHEIEVI
tara:strand:- start:3384 stop:3911 length:528 start_codon:yes stop_codon:yes gene_type:complete